MSFEDYLRVAKRSMRLLLINPKILFRRVFLELRFFLFYTPKKNEIKKINGLDFEFDFSYGLQIKKMYIGTYEMGVINVMKSILKKGDTFFDVGANIGYLTIMGASLVGQEGQVHSFEPVPEYFKKLFKNAENNIQYRIFINNFALGQENKFSNIYVRGEKNIGNNTLIKGLIESKDAKSETEIKIKKFDDYVEDHAIKKIKLIKIDTEGYELFVLNGMEKFLQYSMKKNILPFIICEISPPALKLSGSSTRDLLSYLKKFSYEPFDIANISKKVTEKSIESEPVLDVIFKPKI